MMHRRDPDIRARALHPARLQHAIVIPPHFLKCIAFDSFRLYYSTPPSLHALLPSFPPPLSLLTFSLLIPIVPVEEAQPNKIAPIINQKPTLNTFIPPHIYIHTYTISLSLSLNIIVSDPPLSLSIHIYAISVYIIAIRPKGSYDDVSRRILRFLEPGTCCYVKKETRVSKDCE